ncbi:hypothetical protein PN462_11120, partial [Spirulina sp. CS-785/01]|uniref:hypothetical protein n=1 Tax=Spirulina sp. CS-785/01 TaxID=3021716 RepID=UPI00232C3CA5
MSNLTADQTPTGSDYYANLVGFAFDIPDILETSAYEYAYDPRESAFTSVYEQPTVSPYGEFDLGIRSGAADTGVFTEGTSSEGLVIGESAFVNLAFSRTDGTGLDASEVETWFMQDYYAANGDYGFDPIAVALFEDVGLDQSESDRVLGGYFGDAPPEDGSSSGEDGSSSGEDGSSSGEDGSSSGEDG